jgi:hypothetical protein
MYPRLAVLNCSLFADWWGGSEFTKNWYLACLTLCAMNNILQVKLLLACLNMFIYNIKIGNFNSLTN